MPFKNDARLMLLLPPERFGAIVARVEVAVAVRLCC